MRTTFTFHSATQILFGRDAVRQLGDAVRALPAKRLFVVTDRNLIQAGVWEPVHAALSEAGIVIWLFTGGQAEPSLKLANECAGAAAEVRPDAMMGLGGGSNMDLAK